MIADAVKGLAAQVECGERDVGTPDRVVVSARHVGRQSILAGMPTGAVPAVVSESDGLSERQVQTQRPRN